MTTEQLKAKASEAKAAYRNASTDAERYAAELRFSSYMRDLLKAKKEGKL
jgi:hypothetical protein